MWEQLFSALLLERAGFQVEHNYEETLNEYFLENPEDEFLLELEFASYDRNKSLHMLRTKYDICHDNNVFISALWEQLQKVRDNSALEEFESCFDRLWQLLPLAAKKHLERADTIYREMFQDYLDSFDRTIHFGEFVSARPGSVTPDFQKAESQLGFPLRESVRDFYSRAFAKKVEGRVNIPAKGFTLPIGNARFDTWFSFNKIRGKTEFQLFPCANAKGSARFIYGSFTEWTGGNDFGERAFIGELFTGIGAISLVINNQTGAVEWVDCEYGQYDNFEENPHGILADSMDSFLLKFS